MKVAFEVSNELMHFSKSSVINWDAWGRNVATASRIIKELVARRIVNTMQRVADSYLAGEITGENIAAQLQDSANFKPRNSRWLHRISSMTCKAIPLVQLKTQLR